MFNPRWGVVAAYDTKEQDSNREKDASGEWSESVTYRVPLLSRRHPYSQVDDPIPVELALIPQTESDSEETIAYIPFSVITGRLWSPRCEENIYCFPSVGVNLIHYITVL